ncbi:hypothetical protein [Spirosoma sp. KUDC1026]|uniref:hypothetical protein n=1 Tax=Spirosoma sp. KUDC1026 TaxID=2745947 RepID=UPI00159B8617|nr:hypothetical protein [Spirosoma sp. KUDC1026]QKZ13764.1 hypothetical protein HU175_14435 [Spirosoma sp. KUDC1026]
MFTVLYRTLVLPFYVRNAGTLMIVVLLAFGFMRPMDHEALITAALGSPFLLSLVFVGWGLYAWRTISFVRNQLLIPEHLFLRTFRLVPPVNRYLVWLGLATQLLLPVIGYAAWMLARAVHYQTWGSLSAIVFILIALIGCGAAAADFRPRNPVPFSLTLPSLSVQLPYVLFYPTYWLRQEPLSLVLTKTISMLLLVGVCRLYPTDDYDQRLLLIGLMLAIIAHSQVGRQQHAFEQRYLLLLPNLPLFWFQRLGRYVLTYGLIWLPELLIILRNCPDKVSLIYGIGLWLTGWGWLLLLHSLAATRNITPERWQTSVFWAFIIGLISIMFGLPVGGWLVIGWLGATGFSRIAVR